MEEVPKESEFPYVKLVWLDYVVLLFEKMHYGRRMWVLFFAVLLRSERSAVLHKTVLIWWLLSLFLAL